MRRGVRLRRLARRRRSAASLRTVPARLAHVSSRNSGRDLRHGGARAPRRIRRSRIRLGPSDFRNVCSSSRHCGPRRRPHSLRRRASGFGRCSRQAADPTRVAGRAAGDRELARFLWRRSVAAENARSRIPNTPPGFASAREVSAIRRTSSAVAIVMRAWHPFSDDVEASIAIRHTIASGNRSCSARTRPMIICSTGSLRPIPANATLV
jgi:hypothetical protein